MLKHTCMPNGTYKNSQLEEMEYGHCCSTDEEPCVLTKINRVGQTTLEDGCLILGRDGLYNCDVFVFSPTSITVLLDGIRVFTSHIGTNFHFQVNGLQSQALQFIISPFETRASILLPPVVLQYRRVNSG
jgi:hypothetical protein